MKIWTSYFYKVRFLSPNQIPVSTALWDPKWFHMSKGQNHKFVDKRGVLNGLRFEDLHPGKSCEGLCRGKPCEYSPDSCRFMENYRTQIFSLDRANVMSRLAAAADKVKTALGFSEDPEIVFLVHEAPDNACSERKVLQEFFACDELP